MSISLAYKCTRMFFVAFNAVFWLMGCGSLGVGVWLYLAKTNYQAITPANYGALSAAGLCMAAGATIIVVGFVGCCGAFVENKFLILTYFVFVILVFSVELTAGVLGFLYRNNVNDAVRAELYAHMNDPFISSDGRHGKFSITWDNLQTEFSCCGVDNYKDWFGNSKWDSSGEKRDWVPDSCCNPQRVGSGPKVDCGKIPNAKLWYQTGCYEAFRLWLVEHMHVVGVVGILFAVIQLFGLVASMVLYCGMWENQQYKGCVYHKQK